MAVSSSFILASTSRILSPYLAMFSSAVLGMANSPVSSPTPALVILPSSSFALASFLAESSLDFVSFSISFAPSLARKLIWFEVSSISSPSSLILSFNSDTSDPAPVSAGIKKLSAVAPIPIAAPRPARPSTIPKSAPC